MPARAIATERLAKLSIVDGVFRVLCGLAAAAALYALGTHNGNLSDAADHNAHVAVIHAQADGQADTTDYRAAPKAEADILPTVHAVASANGSTAVTADAVTAASFETDATQLAENERYFYAGTAAMLLVSLRGLQQLAVRMIDTRAYFQAKEEEEPVHVPSRR